MENFNLKNILSKKENRNIYFIKSRQDQGFELLFM